MTEVLPRATISFPLPGLNPQAIRQQAGIDLWVNDEPSIMPREELLRRVRDSTGVIVTPGDGPIDKSWMRVAGDSLRVISCYSVGVDYVDLNAAKDRGISVGHTPGATTEPTADIAWLLILGASRRIRIAMNCIENGWHGIQPNDDYGLRIAGKTLLIVGAGQIGTAVARRAVAWDMNVLYVSRGKKDRIEAPPINASRTSLEDGLAEADIVSVHVPLTPNTTHMFSHDEFSRMKRTAVFVNTSRGGVVNEEALIEALEKGILYAAGLDVYENEPAIPDRLARLDNAILLPHIGTATREDREWLTRLAVDNLCAALQGTPLPHFVAVD